MNRHSVDINRIWDYEQARHFLSTCHEWETDIFPAEMEGIGDYERVTCRTFEYGIGQPEPIACHTIIGYVSCAIMSTLLAEWNDYISKNENGTEEDFWNQEKEEENEGE